MEFSRLDEPAIILADLVQDTDANIMKLAVKKVEGIDEPVKLISPMGFAVGA